MNTNDIKEVKKFLLNLQNRICTSLEEQDSGVFIKDSWKSNLGYGQTRVLENSVIIEKGGVNFSHVKGKTLPASAALKNPKLEGCSFEAMGVSIVIHPKNPYIPTSHANVRFFIAKKKGQKDIWWFGGGFDLTPYYAFEDDVIYWHTCAKKACEPFGTDVYTKYKKWCDEYFYIKHRKEPRGVGGLFFDDLNEWGDLNGEMQANFEKSFSFMRAVGETYIQAYNPILKKRKDFKYTNKEREFQCYRRGRYVEFNLIQDRGTIFGLQSGGRTESILMSLPPVTHWNYNYQPVKGSAEDKLYTDFLIPKQWV